MNAYRIAKLITKLYFAAAIAGSFAHIITSAHKVGLTGWEAWATPFMIDGLAVMGIIMRGIQFSKRTRKIGFRTQLVMGSMSLTANVYAAHNLGGVIFGVGVVALFIFSEWLADNMESVAVDQAAEVQAKRQAATAKAVATRKRNARVKAQETKVLEKMLTR